MIARSSVISYSWKGLAILGVVCLLWHWTFSQSFLSESWDSAMMKSSSGISRRGMKALHRKSHEMAVEFPFNITTVPTGEPIRGENNIMFVETSCLVNKLNTQKIMSVRQTCSIESAAKMNPEAKVYLLHSCPFDLETQITARQLLYYPNVKFWTMSLENLVTDTPLQTWDYNSALKSSQWPLEHSSDIVRFLLLWKYGGLYMDLDFIVIRSLASLEKNFVCAETDEELGSSVIKLNHNATGHRLADICVQQLSKDFRGDLWSHNGPQRITNALLELCKADKMADVNPHSCDMTVHTSQTFFPVAYWEWKMLFNDSDEKDVEERIKNSFGVHIWNKLSFEEKVYPGSKQPYSTLADEFCPLAYSTAGEFF